MPLSRAWIPSPNYSSRGSSSVRLIVIHSSEGAQTYQSLGNYFANPSSQVSSHTGIDNTPNVIGEYVRRDNKAWTAGNANPVAVQTELCTPSGASANWSASQWIAQTTMLDNLAQWIREEAAYYNIPIVRLTPTEAQTTGRGVCQHSDLGAWGGGHYDCGPNFPIDTVIAQAASGTTPTPTPPTPTPTPPTEDDMPGPVTINNGNNQEAFYVAGNGRLVHGYQTPGRPWVTENLSSGWDPKAQLATNVGPGNVIQIWGMTAAGTMQQCYWSGKQWVTQPIG